MFKRKGSGVWSDDELVEKLRTGEDMDLAVEMFYKKFFPIVEKHLQRYQAEPDQIADIFQDVAISITSNIERFDDDRKVKLSTYIKNAAYKKYISSNRESYLHVEKEKSYFEEFSLNNRDIDNLLSEDVKYGLSLLFQHIGESCKKMLIGFYDGRKLEDLASELGFKNADSAHKHKKLCTKKALTFFENHPQIKELLTDYLSKV